MLSVFCKAEHRYNVFHISFFYSPERKIPEKTLIQETIGVVRAAIRGARKSRPLRIMRCSLQFSALAVWEVV